MSGRLLSAPEFDTLLAAPDFNHFLSELDDTQYGPYIEEAVIEGIRPTLIDRAFNRNMVKEFTKIRNFFEGRPHELVGILLARWDLYNLKTILRGKQALVPNSEIIRALMPMGIWTKCCWRDRQPARLPRLRGRHRHVRTQLEYPVWIGHQFQVAGIFPRT